MSLAKGGSPRHLQGEIYDSVKQFGGKEFYARRLGADVQILVGLPRAKIGEVAKRLQLAEEATHGRSNPSKFRPALPQRIAQQPQGPPCHTMAAYPDLKTPGAQPRLVQCPAFADLSQDPLLRHQAIFK